MRRVNLCGPKYMSFLFLHVLAQNPNNANYLTLFDLFPAAHLPHIVGFKFQQYSAVPAGGDGAVAESTPRSLLFAAACLIASGVCVCV